MKSCNRQAVKFIKSLTSAFYFRRLHLGFKSDKTKTERNSETELDLIKHVSIINVRSGLQK